MRLQLSWTWTSSSVWQTWQMPEWQSSIWGKSRTGGRLLRSFPSCRLTNLKTEKNNAIKNLQSLSDFLASGRFGAMTSSPYLLLAGWPGKGWHAGSRQNPGRRWGRWSPRHPRSPQGWVLHTPHQSSRRVQKTGPGGRMSEGAGVTNSRGLQVRLLTSSLASDTSSDT